MDCGRGINLPYDICRLADEYDFIHATIFQLKRDVDPIVMRDGRLQRPLCFGRMLRLGIRAYATAFAKDQWHQHRTSWFPLFNVHLADDAAELEKQKRRGRVPARCLRVEPEIRLLLSNAFADQMTRATRVRMRRAGIELFGIQALKEVDRALETTLGLYRRYLCSWPNPHTSDGRSEA